MMVLLSEIVEYFLILAFVEPKHLSNMKFQINLIYGLKVLSMLIHS